MKRSVFSLILIVSSIAVFAQANDPVVMNINGKDVKMSEFEYIYNKNNNEDAIDKRTLDEYVVLFKNFKLRVAEAEAQGMDTTAAFHKELNEYRTQLARPYLTLKNVNEDILKEAYKRAQVYNEISGLFIAFPDIKEKGVYSITPADTLETYNKAMEIRKQTLKKGADFEKLVTEYSDDENSKQLDRPGFLGWYSSMDLVPSLEIPIYNTPEGQISMPVRTPQGYYLLKVHRKKANPGEVHAAHILIACPADADTVQVSDAQKKLEEIKEKLKGGAEFSELAEEYSSDQGTASRGGDLSWFGYGRMVPEFNDKVFSMTEIGSVSEPVRSRFGFHIIKLLGKRDAAEYDKVKAQIQTKFERTGSYYEVFKPEIDRLKKEHNYSVNTSVYNNLLNTANSTVPTDSTYISGLLSDNQTLMSVDGATYTVADFAQHLKNNPRSFFNLSTEIFQDKYDQFVYDQLMAAEDRSLEKKHPEFRNLMQEYRDGILLFEVSNKEVWERASVDTLGLADFFEKNKNKYAWSEPHWKGYVVLTKDSENKKKMQKEVSKMKPEAAVNYLLENYKVGEVSYVKIEKGLFKKGQNAFVDESVFKSGKAEFPEEYQDFFLIGKLLKDKPESYTDVRGLVITDYQDHLEKQWLESLNAKYPVKINKEVIDTLK
ncbi:MAG: peptidylprolyl isomerase [Bacteroidales bacterium]|nr:peptidylprolyl isomerase [Bacteroidales bacterium]